MLIEFLSNLISGGIETGEFRPVDVPLAVRAVIGTLTALWLAVILEEHPPADIEATADALIDFYLHGLAARSE